MAVIVYIADTEYHLVVKSEDELILTGTRGAEYPGTRDPADPTLYTFNYRNGRPLKTRHTNKPVRMRHIDGRYVAALIYTAYIDAGGGRTRQITFEATGYRDAVAIAERHANRRPIRRLI
ncbi:MULTISPECIES: hypothetical protein [unclassified Nocardia]|uniref:hypothetical protein n=1 Tax=unclassified Nocardia TaxID=2637762 RepID=UPI00278BBB62|nr:MULTISPECIES: hypothetical protein [unclassified Nocardia]